MDGETELEMVRRHIREGDDLVKRQGELVAILQEDRAPAVMTIALLDQSMTLLDRFVDIQRLHKAHLARLEAS